MAIMSNTTRPHPKNVPGDFYVEDGCCLYCGMPEVTAPTLFAWDDSGHHCFVARQPTTPEEVGNMLEAMRNSEVECVRYRGQASDIVRRVVEYGQGHLLDLPFPPHLREIVRTHASFDLTADFGNRPTAREVAENLETYLQRISNKPYLEYRFVGVRMNSDVASFAYGWTAGTSPHRSAEPQETKRLPPRPSFASRAVRHESCFEDN